MAQTPWLRCGQPSKPRARLLDKDVAADAKPISKKSVADVSAIRTMRPAAKSAKVKDNGKKIAVSEAMKMFTN